MSPLDIQQESVTPDAKPGPFHTRDDVPRGRFWAVAQTHPQAERWADASLRSRGYQTFLPLITRTRRDRVLPTLLHRVSVPLFPSYLFFGVDGVWTPARYSQGVRSILMANGTPARVSDDAVAAVREAVEAAEARAATPTAWAPGTPCSLVLGALVGQPAVVLSVTGRNATVAVLMLGCLRHAHVPLTALAPRE
jgi:transcription antitermination factor NusG